MYSAPPTNRPLCDVSDLVPGRLRRSAPRAALLSAHQLRVDAVRRILSAHGARVGVHLRAAPRPMAYGFRLDGARSDSRRVRLGTWHRRSPGGHNTVSVYIRLYA